MSNLLLLLLDNWKAKKLGKPAIAKRQQLRLAEMVKFARQNSHYYKDLYEGLPENIKDAHFLYSGRFELNNLVLKMVRLLFARVYQAEL